MLYHEIVNAMILRYCMTEIKNPNSLFFIFVHRKMCHKCPYVRTMTANCAGKYSSSCVHFLGHEIFLSDFLCNQVHYILGIGYYFSLGVLHMQNYLLAKHNIYIFVMNTVIRTMLECLERIISIQLVVKHLFVLFLVHKPVMACLQCSVNLSINSL